MFSSIDTKWQISIFSAIVAFLVFSPFIYNLLNSLTSMVGINIADNGCPTTVGLLVHAVIFMLVVRWTMDMNLFQ